MTLVGTQAGQVFFDAIERLDLSQAFLCDRSLTRLDEIMQFTAGMGPAIGQCHILCRAFEQAVIACDPSICRVPLKLLKVFSACWPDRPGA